MGDARLAARIETELAKAGLEGWMPAVDIATGAQISYRGEELCAAASTAKVPILVALMRAVGTGDADLDENRCRGGSPDPRTIRLPVKRQRRALQWLTLR